MNTIIETTRLKLRKISANDSQNIAKILQNIEVMYAWEHAFTQREVTRWIENNLLRYQKDGYGFLAVEEKSTNNFIGMMGPLVETINGINHIGIAYIINNTYWGNGFAAEGAKACIDYAFNSLNANEVIAEIKLDNNASKRVAEKLGMSIVGDFIKHYNGKEMVHFIYSINKTSWHHKQ